MNAELENEIRPYHEQAEALANWAERFLANRRDAWGQYHSVAGRGVGNSTARTAKGELTHEIFLAHFRSAEDRGSLVGLHTTSLDNTSRWFAIDIDAHDEGADPEANLRAAKAWYGQLQKAGFNRLLIDSNGRGGYHLWVILADSLPTERVYAFAQDLISDWKTYGLKKAPETLPKQPHVNEGDFGSWLRLPGLHHTLDHVSTAWDGTKWVDAATTVSMMVALSGDDPALILERKKDEAKGEMKTDSSTPSDEQAKKCLVEMLRMKANPRETDSSKRLFSCACRCVEHDLDGKAAIDTIREYERHQPFQRNYQDEEILARLSSAEKKAVRGQATSKESEPKSSDPRKGQATMLVELMEDCKFWHTSDGESWATIASNGHMEHYEVSSKAFSSHIRQRFYGKYRGTPTAQAIKDSVALLQSKAEFVGKEHTIHLRTGEHNGVHYLDLCDSEWRVVEISKCGWRVVENPPIRFKRRKGMLPLPEPAANGEVRDLREFVNLESEDDWTLLLVWLVAALTPNGPYPILLITGEQGSAKSTITKMIRALVDPNSVPLRAEPSNLRDLMISAKNSKCIVLDNLSGLPTWLSDGFCRLSTGGGFATRELYSDDEEVLVEAKRPIILNGIPEFITRGDLLDRVIHIHLPAIPDEKRRAEIELWEAFDNAKPHILGAVLSALASGLANIDSIGTVGLPRMADFAKLGMAVEGAFGLAEGSFMKAYDRSRNDSIEQLFEGSQIWGPFQQLMASRGDKGWTGTATGLLKDLTGIAGMSSEDRFWPRNAAMLSNELSRLAPALRQKGIRIKRFKEGKAGTRMIHITTIDNPPSASSASSALPAMPVTPISKQSETDEGGRSAAKVKGSPYADERVSDAITAELDRLRDEPPEPPVRGSIRRTEEADHSAEIT